MSDLPARIQQYKDGTSGLPREKELALLERYLKQPSILEKIANFATAVTDHVLRGLPMVSDKIYKDRITICENCDRFDKERTLCKECGCYLPIKARWAEQKCPIDKWPAETPSNNQGGCGGCD